MKKILTSFVLWYLRTAANLQLKKFNPLIIGIAGSSGKSSLGRLLQTVLQTKYAVSTTKEKNSETGIPMHILNLHFDFSYANWLKALILIPLRLLFYWSKYKILVVEMGIDSPVEPKNMSYLLKIVKPVIGMVTNISLEHSVYFDEYVKADSEKERQEKILEMTAQQELLLLRSLPNRGAAIINLDDPLIKKAGKRLRAKQISISIQDENADLFTKKITVSLQDFVMDIVWHEKVYQLKINQPLPVFYAYEFLFTLATALSLDIGLSEAIKSLENNFSLPPGRLSLLNGIKDTIIIDSSYNNGTLEPIMGILDMMRLIAGRRRKVAIIGDMRELGSQSREYHEIVAERLALIADKTILIGPLMKNYAAPILKRKKADFESFTTFTEAKETILNTTSEKDLILVKGSQNTLFLERVVEMLLADEKDISKLCRRGEFWDKKREESA